MSTGSSCQIPSNSDIDGIGIRLALYFQTFTIVLIVAVSPKRALESWWTGIVSAVALQVTGFASAARSNLTLYHALLLTWLTFPMAAMAALHSYLYWGSIPPTSMVFGQVVGLLLYLAFLLWVWATAPHFGPNPECNHTVKFALFWPSWNPLGLIRYFILYYAAVPTLLLTLGILLVTAEFILIIASSISIRAQNYRKVMMDNIPDPGPKALSDNCIVAINTALLTFCLGLSVVMVELMIHINDVTPGSENWSYGQIVAIILLAGPLFTLQRVVREELHHSNIDPLSQRPLAYYMHHIRCWWMNEKPIEEDEPSADAGDKIELHEIRVALSTSTPSSQMRKRASTL